MVGTDVPKVAAKLALVTPAGRNFLSGFSLVRAGVEGVSVYVMDATIYAGVGGCPGGGRLKRRTIKCE